MNRVEYEPCSKQSLRIQPITQDTYDCLTLEYQDPEAKIIAQKSWEYLNPNQVTINDGAAPCSIIWVYDKSQRQMILSGHFLTVDKDAYIKFISTLIEYGVPKAPITSNELLKTRMSHNWHLSKINLSRGYEEFVDMTKELKRVVTDCPQNYEAYLFGQNFSLGKNRLETMQNLVKNTIEQNSLTTGLYQAGLLPTQVFDYRSPRHFGGDDTIYIPSEQTIYHLHLD